MTHSIASTDAALAASRRPWHGRLATLGAAAALLLGASAVRAEPPQGDRAQAEVLFRAARRLVAQGNYAEACPKFEESFSLYPAASTKLNLAKCHEEEGKLLLAWQDYREALALIRDMPAPRRDELAPIATSGMEALEARLPRLRIVIPRPPAGIKVLRDGALVPAAELGEPLPIAPGQHEVSASAPGYPAKTRSVIVEAGKTTTVELSLEPAAPPQRNVPTWVWISGGAGIALTGLGLYFLATDLAAISDLRSNCHVDAGTTYCAPGYDPGPDNAQKNRGLGLFLGLGGVGAVAIGVAAGGLLQASAAPRSSAPAVGLTVSPWVVRGGGGSSVSGVF